MSTGLATGLPRGQHEEIREAQRVHQGTVHFAGAEEHIGTKSSPDPRLRLLPQSAPYFSCASNPRTATSNWESFPVYDSPMGRVTVTSTGRGLFSITLPSAPVITVPGMRIVVPSIRF